MKKIFNILLILLFLFTTTGFTITKHFCRGNLVEVAINSTPEPCCDTKGCCHNESEFFQLKEDFSSVQFSIVDVDHVIDVSLFCNENFELETSKNISSIYLIKGFIPPPDLMSALADIQNFRL